VFVVIKGILKEVNGDHQEVCDFEPMDKGGAGVAYAKSEGHHQKDINVV
jgi:hypothetical protein